MPSRGGVRTMTTGPRATVLLMIGLILLASLETIGGVPYRRSLVRLCSKNLSDALHLACRNRGYNEPFLQSGETGPQDAAGPGLADECCYRACSYTQLEQYCKPMSDKEQSGSSDAVKESVIIVNLPYPSARPETSSEERSRSRSGIDFVGSTIKCKIHGMKGARRRGMINEDGDDDGDADEGCKIITETGKRHRGGRHCKCRRQRRQQRRRRLGKERAGLAKL